jgi:hypothetical protein
MVRRERRIEPRPELKKLYHQLYEEVYLKVRPSVTNVFHALANLRGGGGSGDSGHGYASEIGRNGATKTTPIIISPSLLASDW